MKQPSAVFIAHADKLQNIKGLVGGQITYKRNSVGFSIKKDSLLDLQPVDYPRTRNRGGYISYISEGTDENIYKYSSDFSNAVHNKTGTVSFSHEDSVAPNGKLEATVLRPIDEASVSKYTQQNLTPSSSGTHTFSMYLKSDGIEEVSLRIFLNASPWSTFALRRFNLVEGTIVSGVSGEGDIEYAGNGWYRVSVTADNLTQASHTFRVELPTTGTNLIDGVLLWGGQVEKGIRASSLMPTTSVAETRDSDYFSAIVYDDEIRTHITSYFNLKLHNTGNNNSIFTFKDTSGDNYIRVRSQLNGTDIGVEVKMDGELFTDAIYVGNYDQDIKIAFSISDGTLRVSVNGEIESTNTFSKLSFSSGLNSVINSSLSPSDDSDRFIGLINEIMIFPMSLSDAEMNFITGR